MNTLNKTESTSALATHFLRDLQNHPPRRLDNERQVVRKDLDALLPIAGHTQKNAQTQSVEKPDLTDPSRRPKVDLDQWIATSMIASLAIGMVGLVAYILRNATASTFWGGVGFTTLILGGAVMVSLWGGKNNQEFSTDEVEYPRFRFISLDYSLEDKMLSDD